MTLNLVRSRFGIHIHTSDRGGLMDTIPHQDARGAMSERILAEQIALLCKLTIPVLIVTCIPHIVLVWLIHDDYGWLASSIWYCALLLVSAARWKVARAYLSQPYPPENLRRWRRWMIGLLALSGLVMSLPASLMLPRDHESELTVMVLLIAASAAGAATLVSMRGAPSAFLLALLLPIGLTQLWLGGERVLLALCVLTYIPVVLMVARSQTNSLEDHIRLASENETLAHELRRERDRANQVNEELQRQIEQQQRSNNHIKNLNRDLELQAVELRQANADLEGFSYSVSHDLRTPLRGIHGFSSQLEQKLRSQGDSETQRFLARIKENVLRMSTLIDDLLEFSKCGRLPLELSELDMDSLARTAAVEAVSAYQPANPPEITIEPLPSGLGDPRLMLQVWRNLLDNAVKYSSKVDRPRIVVRGYQESDRVRFEVSDNGVGFDSLYSEALFGVFRRLHRTSEYPGSGVGLAIVERIVTRHEGKVWAHSELNQGSTFGFSLPRVARMLRELVESPVHVNGEHDSMHDA